MLVQDVTNTAGQVGAALMRPERKWALFKKEQLSVPNLENTSNGGRKFSIDLANYCFDHLFVFQKLHFWGFRI